MWTLCVVKLAFWGQVSYFQGKLVTYRTAPVQVSLMILGGAKIYVCSDKLLDGGATAPLLRRP